MNKKWELCNKKGIEFIRRRIDAVSPTVGEGFEYYAINLIDNELYEICHMFVFPSYEIVPITVDYELYESIESFKKDYGKNWRQELSDIKFLNNISDNAIRCDELSYEEAWKLIEAFTGFKKESSHE